MRAAARWTGAANGRLLALDALPADRVGVSLKIEAQTDQGAALTEQIARWEKEARKQSLRRRAQLAPSIRRGAPDLVTRPALAPDCPILRLIGARRAIGAWARAYPAEKGAGPDQTSGERCGVAAGLDQPALARLSAQPIYLPAAGVVALEFRLLDLAPGLELPLISRRPR